MPSGLPLFYGKVKSVLRYIYMGSRLLKNCFLKLYLRLMKKLNAFKPSLVIKILSCRLSASGLYKYKTMTKSQN